MQRLAGFALSLAIAVAADTVTIAQAEDECSGAKTIEQAQKQCAKWNGIAAKMIQLNQALEKQYQNARESLEAAVETSKQRAEVSEASAKTCEKANASFATSTRGAKGQPAKREAKYGEGVRSLETAGSAGRG
jgi:DNA anti-recombination protein RmuC